jgi:3-methyl-2-oxobutanoate hydroxymethyltransferase
MKQRGEKIPMVTAYDFPTAKLLEMAGIPIILVGDSLGQVVLGYESTVRVTMEEMLHHTKAVVRGTTNSLIVADMPFLTYQTGTEEAVKNAGRFLQEGMAQAVKLEGGLKTAPAIKSIVAAGIPVMGHIGFTPQSVYQLGGYRVLGKTLESANEILSDALAVEEAGAFAIVLELVPDLLAKFISSKLSIPTIGIGAGLHCDGQVQVLHDMLGLIEDFTPKHAKQYALIAVSIRQAVESYITEVQRQEFPTEKESFPLTPHIFSQLTRQDKPLEEE